MSAYVKSTTGRVGAGLLAITFLPITSFLGASLADSSFVPPDASPGRSRERPVPLYAESAASCSANTL